MTCRNRYDLTLYDGPAGGIIIVIRWQSPNGMKVEDAPCLDGA